MKRSEVLKALDNINEYSDTEIAVNTEFIRKIALADYGLINRVRQIDSGGVTMDYGRVPLQYIKTDALTPESAYASESLKCKDTRKATAEDIARFEAEMASRAKREAITVNIRGEAPKHEKKPEVPFEEIPRKPQRLGNQYNPVKFDGKVAG
jgi:hypothetical protein